MDYDILDYDVDVAFTPERLWIDGRVRMRLKVRAAVLGALTLRLADAFVVQSIVSYEHGRLFGIRVKNQNTLVVNLPALMPRDSEITLTIAYAGRLEPQTPDRETLALAPDQRAQDETLSIAPEPSYLYSSRSYGARRRRSATTRPRASESPSPRRSSASRAASWSRASRDC